MEVVERRKKMKRKGIVETLMKRDSLSRYEAEELCFEASDELQRRLVSGESPFDFCAEMFGLEDDYLDELL